MNKRIGIFSIGVACVLAACNGTDASLTASSAAAALTTAQCNYQSFKTAAQACFDTFDACQAAAGSSLDDCRAALKACLPAPPEGSHPGHGGRGDGDCAGGGRGEPRSADGGRPAPGREGGGPGAHRGPPPGFPIDSAAITACRDQLAACLSVTGADQKACFEADRACAREAFGAAFGAKCDQAAAACALPEADAAACARVAKRCDQGVDAAPEAVDGGTCQ
jgi:hypothetical protein